MTDIAKIHDELESLNRERERVHAEQRERALEMAKQRNDLYTAAMAARDAIGQDGFATFEIKDGEDSITVVREVRVYDPDLLDKDTLAVLEHMGTPVPPVDDVFPGGVRIPNRRSK